MNERTSVIPGSNPSRSGQPSRWAYLLPTLLGVLFGLCTYVGNNDGNLTLRSPLPYLYALCFALLFVIMFAATLQIVCHQHSSAQCPAALRRLAIHLPLRWSTASVAAACAIILLCWSPYLIAFFPGIYWYDTSNQLVQILDPTVPVTDHHPFTDTYLYGAFASLGSRIFAEPMYGLFLLIALQMVATAVTLAIVVCYLERHGLSWRVRLGTLVFFALFPFLPATFSSLAKDTLSAPFFVLFCVMCVEISRAKGQTLRSPWFVVLLAIDMLAAGLTKKTGVYVTTLSLLALVFVVKGLRAKLTAVCTALATAGAILIMVPALIMPALQVGKGQNSEMLAVPLQQVANVTRNHADTLTSEQADAIKHIYGMTPQELAQAYSIDAADPIKNKALSREDEQSLMRIWLTELIQHPSDMVAGWATLSKAWFSFDSQSLPGILDPNWMQVTYSSEHRDPGVTDVMRWHDDTLAGTFVSTLYTTVFIRTPVLNLLFSKAFWGGILPFLIAFLALCAPRGKRFKTLMLSAPVLVTALTLYVGPTSAYLEAVRYALPLVCVAPLFLALLTHEVRRCETDAEIH